MKPESELIKRIPTPEEVPKAKEIEKAPSDKKRSWPRMLGTIGLILGLSAIWFYLAAMITGHDGTKGPWNLLSHKIQGQYALLFTGMIIITVLISIKMGIISWGPARKMVIFASILLAIQVLGLSIWQEDWQPREWLRSIGKGDGTANAHVGPTAWQTTFEKTYTGKGYGKGDKGSVPTVYAGKDVFYENKIIVTGKEFEVWYGSQWHRHYDKYEVINRYSGPVDSYDVKAPKGEKLTVKIQKLL